jgi:hypothetical protein
MYFKIFAKIRPRIASAAGLIVLGLSVLLFASCRDTPPTHFEIMPLTCDYLMPGEEITLFIEGTVPNDALINWSAEMGEINPDTGSRVVYTASQSGIDTITAMVVVNEVVYSDFIECSILAPAATEAPVATEAPAEPPTEIATEPPTEIPTETPNKTPTAMPSPMPNSTAVIQAAFNEIDRQFQDTLESNIAFNRPEQMKRDDTTTIELILSPSLSQSALATQVVERGNFVTSTADPNILIAPNGEMVTVQTSQIEITPRMKAVLLPQDPEAFTVTNMLDAEQVVSTMETTTWRWSVSAKKEGSQTLELTIYQLVKYDEKEFWHQVETYKANIVVEVTPLDKIKSLDWKWFAGFILLLVGSVIGVLNYLNSNKKKAKEENKPSAPRRIK